MYVSFGEREPLSLLYNLCESRVVPLMESLGAIPQSELEPKLEPGVVDREIDAARALVGMAFKESDPTEKAVKDGRQAKAADKHTPEKTEKAKNSGSTSQPLIGRRGKQNLTEAEREAKRQRRILANRESARQTILKRQALREGLAQEVAVLSSENQHMKMEKEFANQEFLSLKETNKKLKEQLAWLYMSQAGAQYMWCRWIPRLHNHTRWDPNACGSDPSPNPRLQETPSSSGTERYEEKQFLPNGLETDVSCSLTLGLETKTKSKMPGVKTSHNKFVTEKTCSKDSDVVKVPLSVKVAADARRKRREIIKLKQMYRN